MTEQYLQSPNSLKQIQKDNIIRIFDDNKELPRKILVLDAITMSIISLQFLKSSLYDYQIFDTTNISSITNISHGNKGYSPIYILEPKEENIKLLQNQIEQSVFKDMKIYFINSITNENIEILAKTDVNKATISLVKEIFIGYEALDDGLFTLMGSKGYKSFLVKQNLKSKREKKILKGIEESLYSFFLGMREIPSIHYKKKSDYCKKLAERLGIKLERDYSQHHTDFHSKKSTNLIIIDRAEDAVSPLQHTWSYQSMIHELLELELNVLQQKLDSDDKFLLESDTDSFYQENKFKNFGEFADNLSKLLATTSRERGNMGNTGTIKELQEALDHLPEFQLQGKITAKHSKIVSKIISLCKNSNLYDISFQQQEIVTISSMSKGKVFRDLCAMIVRPEIPDIEKLKLAMTFVLRFEDDLEKISHLKVLLGEHSSITYATTLIEKLLNVYGKESRSTDLFGDRDFSLSSVSTNILKKFQDEPNVYERFKPKVVEIVDMYLKNKFKIGQFGDIYPFGCVDSNSSSSLENNKIVVFIIGGATYQEYKELTLYAEKLKKTTIYLGTDKMINSEQFINILRYDGKDQDNFDKDFDENEGLLKKLN